MKNDKLSSRADSGIDDLPDLDQPEDGKSDELYGFGPEKLRRSVFARGADGKSSVEFWTKRGQPAKNDTLHRLDEPAVIVRDADGKGMFWFVHGEPVGMEELETARFRNRVTIARQAVENLKLKQQGDWVSFDLECENELDELPNPSSQVSQHPPTSVSYRYKIFQIERSRFGALPGEGRIVLRPKSISAVLHDELLSAGGAAAFGVDCDTFAWFENGPFMTLILREEDRHFNIDLAMSQLANLPGKEGIDFFGVIEARITRSESPLDRILQGRGLRPVSGGALPHQGMGGTVYLALAGGATPVFAAPPLPKLVGKPGDKDFDWLIDVWFRQLREILERLNERFGKITLALEGGGDVPVPNWFMDWCADQGIKIEFLACDSVIPRDSGNHK